jgi:hypothetical protein
MSEEASDAEDEVESEDDADDVMPTPRALFVVAEPATRDRICQGPLQTDLESHYQDLRSRHQMTDWNLLNNNAEHATRIADEIYEKQFGLALNKSEQAAEKVPKLSGAQVHKFMLKRSSLARPGKEKCQIMKEGVEANAGELPEALETRQRKLASAAGVVWERARRWFEQQADARRLRRKEQPSRSKVFHTPSNARNDVPGCDRGQGDANSVRDSSTKTAAELDAELDNINVILRGAAHPGPARSLRWLVALKN